MLVSKFFGSSGRPPGRQAPRLGSLSLRWRLVLLVVASIVPLLAFSLGHEYMGYREEVATAGRQTLGLARSMSLVVEEELQVRIAALQALAGAPALQTGDIDGIRARAETVVAQQFPGARILLIREDGQMVMNTGLPAAAPRPVRPNMESTRRVFATGRPAVSDLFLGAPEPRPVVAIDVPVKSPDGNVAYVLSLTPQLEAFAEIIHRQHPPASWVIAVFDRRGVIIARIPDGDRFIGHEASPSFLGPLQAGREGIVEATSLEGIRVLSAFSHAERFGWAVGIGVPRAELTGPAFAAAMRTLAVGGVLLTLSLVLALYAARNIAGPIESLRRLSALPDRDVFLDSKPTGLREVDEVADALHSAQEERMRSVQAQDETFRTLMKNEAELKNAQRLAHMGSVSYDLRTAERVWSDETYRIFGVARESFVLSDENIFALIHPDDRQRVHALRKSAAAGISPSPIEYRIIRPDGSVRLVYRQLELIHDDAGAPAQLLGTIHDVTERRNIEEQLFQAQKMEAIGNLTGGMAHDFNNLLGVIIGNIDLLRNLTKDDSEVAELAQDALDAALRGAELTRRLLAFARQQPLQPKRVDVNELVSGITKLLSRTLGENIEISLDLAANAWPTVVDPAQLETGLMNLANNSRDAMPNGGQLTIVTANRHLDADYAAQHAEVVAGDYVLIEVGDTGSGMTQEVVSRIFEPFYTTKERDKGTGLGLSMVFGFVKQSSGHINVYSEPGAGTNFGLYLPRMTEDVALTEESFAPPLVRGSGETVLVVEDNAPLRRVVRRQLGESGYRVLEAENAAAALALMEQEDIDLLLTDIVMPGGTDGVELARQALQRRPALGVVFTSGFAEAQINGAGRSLPPGARLLTKPYRRDELAAIVRAALDK